jgi:hypothetical protein
MWPFVSCRERHIAIWMMWVAPAPHFDLTTFMLLEVIYYIRENPNVLVFLSTYLLYKKHTFYINCINTKSSKTVTRAKLVALNLAHHRLLN